MSHQFVDILRLRTAFVVYAPVMLLAFTGACAQDSGDPSASEDCVQVDQDDFHWEEQRSYLHFEANGCDTVLEHLLSHSSEEVQVRGEGSSAFVTAINNVEPDSGQFWELRVDREGAQEGAGQLTPEEGSLVEWRVKDYN